VRKKGEAVFNGAKLKTNFNWYGMWGGGRVGSDGAVYWAVDANKQSTPSVAIVRYDVAGDKMSLIGDIQTASQAAGNWISGEIHKQVHTPLVDGNDGKLYFATKSDDWNSRGTKLYSIDPQGGTLTDVSVNNKSVLVFNSQNSPLLPGGYRMVETNPIDPTWVASDTTGLLISRASTMALSASPFIPDRLVGSTIGHGVIYRYDISNDSLVPLGYSADNFKNDQGLDMSTPVIKESNGSWTTVWERSTSATTRSTPVDGNGNIYATRNPIRYNAQYDTLSDTPADDPLLIRVNMHTAKLDTFTMADLGIDGKLVLSSQGFGVWVPSLNKDTVYVATRKASWKGTKQTMLRIVDGAIPEITPMVEMNTSDGVHAMVLSWDGKMIFFLEDRPGTQLDLMGVNTSTFEKQVLASIPWSELEVIQAERADYFLCNNTKDANGNIFFSAMNHVTSPNHTHPDIPMMIMFNVGETLLGKPAPITFSPKISSMERAPLQFFPNPFKNRLTFFTHTNLAGRVSIFNTLGKVFSKSVQGNNRQTLFNLDPLPAGQYWLRFESAGTFHGQKLIKY